MHKKRKHRLVVEITFPDHLTTREAVACVTEMMHRGESSIIHDKWTVKEFGRVLGHVLAKVM